MRAVAAFALKVPCDRAGLAIRRRVTRIDPSPALRAGLADACDSIVRFVWSEPLVRTPRNCADRHTPLKRHFCHARDNKIHPGDDQLVKNS